MINKCMNIEQTLGVLQLRQGKKQTAEAFCGLSLLHISMSLTQANLFYLHKDYRSTPLNAISPTQREGNPEEIRTADEEEMSS